MSSDSSSNTNPQLHSIDLDISTLVPLIKLLRPHLPHGLQILGTVLNAGPCPSTLQDIDPFKVSLWSAIPFHSDATTTERPVLFSIIAFSHSSRQFCFFCSGDAQTPFGSPTKAEESHVRHVFERLRDIARESQPMYDSPLVAFGESGSRHRINADPPMITVGGVPAKWTAVLAPMSVAQNPNVRYAFQRPRSAVPGEGGLLDVVEVSSDSEIRATDLPFVHGASSIPRSEAYILSRAPYSICARSRMEGSRGQPVACALMHSDGGIGALRVDPNYRRHGLGRSVIRALTEKLDFNRALGEDADQTHSDDHHHWRDSGGGALGWNWSDVGTHNEVGNHFFSSLVGTGGGR